MSHSLWPTLLQRLPHTLLLCSSHELNLVWTSLLMSQSLWPTLLQRLPHTLLLCSSHELNLVWTSLLMSHSLWPTLLQRLPHTLLLCSSHELNLVLDFFTYVPFFMAHSFAKASSHIATLLQPWIEPSFWLPHTLLLCASHELNLVWTSLLMSHSLWPTLLQRLPHTLLLCSSHELNLVLDFFTYVPFFMAHSFAKASSHIATLLQPWIEPSFWLPHTLLLCSSHELNLVWTSLLMSHSLWPTLLQRLPHTLLLCSSHELNLVLDFFTYVPFFMAHSFTKASSHIATLLQPWIEPSFGLLYLCPILYGPLFYKGFLTHCYSAPAMNWT